MKELNLQNVLSLVPQIEALERYTGIEVPVINGQVDHSVKFHSPFREDNRPHCFFKEKDNVISLSDYSSKYYGDCVRCCQHLYKCSLPEALEIVNRDFQLGLGSNYTGKITPYTATIIRPEKVPHKPFIRTIRAKKFPKVDYFHYFGIQNSTLRKFNVHPVKRVFCGKMVFSWSAKHPIYEYKMKEGTKIYRPLSEVKWYTDLPKSALFGYTQLPSSGEELVITKSLKDIMVLYEIGIPAISPQSENIAIDYEIIYELKQRFDNIILIFDNDKTGLKRAKLFSEIYDMDYVIPKYVDLAEHSYYESLEDLKDWYDKTCKRTDST